jgi:hypothetical protein
MKPTDHDGPVHAGGAVATCRRRRAIADDIVRAAIAARVKVDTISRPGREGHEDAGDHEQPQHKDGLEAIHLERIRRGGAPASEPLA